MTETPTVPDLLAREFAEALTAAEAAAERQQVWPTVDGKTPPAARYDLALRALFGGSSWAGTPAETKRFLALYPGLPCQKCAPFRTRGEELPHPECWARVAEFAAAKAALVAYGLAVGPGPA